jgi:Ca2+-binding EF-hand superfamily protein
LAYEGLDHLRSGTISGMRTTTWAGVVALAMSLAACAESEGPPMRNGHVRFDRPGETSVGFPDEDAGGGPRRPREQLFISPSGKPFRAPMGQPYPVAAWFAEADANHDGKITREEFRADAEAYFKVLDTNGDGEISMPEVTRWEEVLVPEIARDASGLGGGFGGGGRRGAPSRNELDTRRQGAAVYSLVNEPHPIRGADSDFSLGVSREEWRAGADRRFDLLDANHDGAITFDELKPTPAQRGLQAQKDSAGQAGAQGQGQGRGGQGGGRRRR